MTTWHRQLAASGHFGRKIGCLATCTPEIMGFGADDLTSFCDKISWSEDARQPQIGLGSAIRVASGNR